MSDDDIKWDIEEKTPAEIFLTSPNSELEAIHKRKLIVDVLGKRPRLRISHKMKDTLIVILLASFVFISIISLALTNQISLLNTHVNNLESQLNTLESQHENLQVQYNNLLDEYNDLFSDFEQLRTAFEKPLTNPIIPTISQVQSWLSQDDTDQNSYVSNVWMCGDYAAMLMTRAKEMNWRIRIVVMFYSFEGEWGYGSTTNLYGTDGHVFNLIDCTDGIWYIEPQSDGTWYIITGITHTRTEFNVHTYYDFTDSDVESIWDGYNWWTNFYGYFG